MWELGWGQDAGGRAIGISVLSIESGTRASTSLNYGFDKKNKDTLKDTANIFGKVELNNFTFQ